MTDWQLIDISEDYAVIELLHDDAALDRLIEIVRVPDDWGYSIEWSADLDDASRTEIEQYLLYCWRQREYGEWVGSLANGGCRD